MVLQQWLKGRLVPYRLKLNKTHLPMLLLINRHKTNITGVADTYCNDNKINYVLPPVHTTQILQPRSLQRVQGEISQTEGPFESGIRRQDQGLCLQEEATCSREGSMRNHRQIPLRAPARSRQRHLTNVYKTTGIYRFSFDTFLANVKHLDCVPIEVKARVSAGQKGAPSLSPTTCSTSDKSSPNPAVSAKPSD